MEPAIQIGQKFKPPAWIIVPITTSAPQAGTSSETKASDSTKQSTNTTGAAQTWCTLHEIDDRLNVFFEHFSESP